jgi:hypothetical protein
VLPAELAVRPAILWKKFYYGAGKARNYELQKKEKTHAGKRIANQESFQYLVLWTVKKIL